MTRTIKLAIGSVIVGIAVLGLKFVAFWLTGSIALYSDALESLVNVATAFVALGAVHFAAHPADKNHPYGHSKAEYFSAVIEGVMIVVAALLIAREAYMGLQHPKLFEAPLAGLLVNGLASVLNGIWSWVLIRQGRRHRSPALVADGKHLFSDVVSSVGVIAGLAVAFATGWAILDPALALVVAVNILWAGWQVLKESLSGLMDEAVSEEVLASIHHTISAHGIGAIEAHAVRTRHAGRMTFVEFHLVVPGQMTIEQAHEICDRIERALKDKIEDLQVTIHVEPEHNAEHTGIVVV
jgi:cation diffusion facilitator family transporter